MSDTLPPLPESVHLYHDAVAKKSDLLYTADQMREYALAAVRATNSCQQTPAQPELLCRLQTHGATLRAGDDPRITCTAEQAARAILDVTGVDVEWEPRQQAQVPDPCLVLWQAMNEAEKVGNRADDKLIVEFLRRASYVIAAAPQAAQPEQAQQSELASVIARLEAVPGLYVGLIERLMRLSTRLGIANGDSVEHFAASLEDRLYAICRSTESLLDSLAAPPAAPAAEPLTDELRQDIASVRKAERWMFSTSLPVPSDVYEALAFAVENIERAHGIGASGGEVRNGQ